MGLIVGCFFLFCIILLTLKFIWQIPVIGKAIIFGAGALVIFSFAMAAVYAPKSAPPEQVDSYKPDFEVFGKHFFSELGTLKSGEKGLQVTNDLPQGEIAPWGQKATLSFDAYTTTNGKTTNPVVQPTKSTKEPIKYHFILHLVRENKRWRIEFVEFAFASGIYSSRYNMLETDNKDGAAWMREIIDKAVDNY